MKIESLLQLIENIKNAEWKFHPTLDTICQIFESNIYWYFSIYLKKTNNGNTVSAVFDFRLQEKEYPIDNIAYTGAKSVIYILEDSKKRLVDHILSIKIEQFQPD